MAEAATSTITPRIEFARELSGLYDLRGQVAFLPGGYGGIGWWSSTRWSSRPSGSP